MAKSNNGHGDDRKALPPLLDEFRSALLDEIEVAKREASSGAVPLTEGHKVGQQGGAFQYAFLIDSILNAPDGSPGDLIVPGKPPMAVTILSVEGLRLLLSAETDLGEFVPSARLQANLAVLMRRLVQRIEANASAKNPGASRMLGTNPVDGSPRAPKNAPKLALNELQTSALESALGRNLTVIWGPPGTGKTRTIGAIAQALHDLNRTVLIVSHTNTAVDQAIKNVARAMHDHLEDGSVIRIGEVKDKQLGSDYPDVLLKEQVRRQSKALAELRDTLDSQRTTLSHEEDVIRRRIFVTEWVEESRTAITSCGAHLQNLSNCQERLTSRKNTLGELEGKRPELVALRDRALHILKLRRTIADSKHERSLLENQLAENALDWEEANRQIQEQDSRLDEARRISPIRDERAKYPSTAEQKSIIETLSGDMLDKIYELNQARLRLEAAAATLEEIRNAGPATRFFRRLPKAEEQAAVVNDLTKKITVLETELTAARAAHASATDRLSKIIELESQLSQHGTIGSLRDELARQTMLEDTLHRLNSRRAEIESGIDELRSTTEELKQEETRYATALGGDAQREYDQAVAQLLQHQECHDSVVLLEAEMGELRMRFALALSPLLTQLLHWGEVPQELSGLGLEQKFELVCGAHRRHAAECGTADVSALKGKADSLHSEVLRLNSEIAGIDERLSDVERQVIAGARIVGATLTKTYLSDDIQARKFDTVILDEASMAPIPALWTAALLAENNLVLVGDFRQLPPIVISTNELSTKWLGRDIFEASGIKALYENGNPPPHFVQLKEQRRMLAEIATVANQFYNDSLETPPDPPEGLERFRGWCVGDWLNKSPVTLVDTGNLNAWVTSVVKGGRASRLNFLSATVAVDLAEQLLSPDRPKRGEGSPKRIIIVSPYSPQAKLTRILLKENPNVRDDVEAGTVHSFQGSEADAVIFDLVVDEPHFRVNLFMRDLDKQIKPLLNVGLTRDRFRLFVLGDFTYCQSKGGQAFLAKTLIPFLVNSFPRVSALDLLPEGLAARAARAQMTLLGGNIEPDSDRLVLTQADFYRVLSADFSQAKRRIIIYSPFMTEGRVSYLMPQLAAACSREVTVILITKSHSERSPSELARIRKIEYQLSTIGVIVMHKMRMHEKLVFIDDDITWVGSLNPLSYSDTRETMERRKNEAVLSDYFQALRLSDLIGVQGTEESKCPICGSEMVAAEGAEEPYYWRCVNDDCYTRGIDQPYPFDGVLTCGSGGCNARLEFGWWGGKPYWRCTKNPHHRQRIFRSHLRLPKMAGLIPRSEQHKIYRILGIGENQFRLVDGVLTCVICNAPVQFAYWGDEPHWCCSQNPLHRRKILESDLRSHRMAGLVPRKEQRKVCLILGINDLASHISRADSEMAQQTRLFDESE